MSLETNKSLVRRYYEEVRNQDNMDSIDEIFSVAAYSQAGLSKLKEGVSRMRTSFPDMHTQILTQIAEDDIVATHWKVAGTHTGEFMGYAPTGRSFETTGSTFHRIRDGKIIKDWGNPDYFGLYQQLGLVTLPEGS